MAKIEKGEYGVFCLDCYGYEVVAADCLDTKSAARNRAKSLIVDPELLQAGLYVVEVRNDKGECVEDYHVAMV